MKLVVRLQRILWRVVADEFRATRDLVGGRAIGVVILVATHFLRDATAVIAVQFSVARRFTCCDKKNASITRLENVHFFPTFDQVQKLANIPQISLASSAPSLQSGRPSHL